MRGGAASASAPPPRPPAIARTITAAPARRGTGTSRRSAPEVGYRRLPMSSLALIAVMLVSGASPPAPPPASGPAVLKLAAPSLTLRGIDDATGAYYLEQLGQAFAERGARVITARDIQQVVGMERQKALA